MPENANGALVQIDPPGPALRFHYDPQEWPFGRGVGGWQVVDRPRRRGALEWQGHDPHEVSLDLLFDRYPTGGSVEAECAQLHRFGMKLPNGHRPPILRVAGRWNMPHVKWVIDDIVWRETIRREDGHRMRQWVTVVLLEHTPADLVVSPAAATRERQQARASPAAPTPARVYTVRSGDTLSSIAARELGSAGRWQEIARLNDLRDPNVIRPGQQLRLP